MKLSHVEVSLNHFTAVDVSLRSNKQNRELVNPVRRVVVFRMCRATRTPGMLGVSLFQVSQLGDEAKF